MKTIPPAVLAALAPRFGARQDQLRFLGGGQDFSDGTVFTFRRGDEVRALKILGPYPAGDGALRVAEARVEAVAILAESAGHGEDEVRTGGTTPIILPLRSEAGRQFEVEEAEGQAFLAYAYPFVPGRRPVATDDAFRERAYHRALGGVLGRLHAAWELVPEALAADGTSSRTPLLGGWREEWRFFRAWCRDDEVGRAWERLREALAALPVEKRGYGFVHNDAHPGNALLAPGAAGGGEPHLALIDFDVANQQFFLCEAAAAVYGLAMVDAGGIETPRGPTPEVLAEAGRHFWEGYRRHRDPGRDWLERLPLFLQYRRCQLFMPFQELTAGQPSWRERWKRRIAAEDAALFG